MAKTNIGAAFGALAHNSLDASGLALSARIACRLTDMSPAEVRAIDSDLSFFAKSITLRPTSGYTAAELVDYRRASELIRKSGESRKQSPSSFDQQAHFNYIKDAKNDLPGPDRPGFYFGASYWAYSDHAERVKTRLAWNEAGHQLTAGIGVIETLDFTERKNLFRRWFGNAGPDVVKLVLQRTLTGITTRCTGLLYAGQAARGNPLGLSENGIADRGMAAAVRSDEFWGIAYYGAPYIRLGTCFFDESETGGQPTRYHSRDVVGAMEVSRGGAIVHEATHLFAETTDVRLSDVPNDAVFLRLNVAVTNQNRDAQGYGPRVCHALAQVSGAMAAKNADNYRLFCEDAFAQLTSSARS
ncbi:M35 family metallopeptidase [Paraburkholderia sp. ZP32-5]|uniref:M35 family metallopeptidase n=1 Tax=Paraburkholderia sp. ZP32-5 TaxID=2883245 RepID=UPI001F28B20C|nr:M35 family metallopeptidase [Paraburkholderia sp. ZP32-5]